jgi:hypothetical protein
MVAASFNLQDIDAHKPDAEEKDEHPMRKIRCWTCTWIVEAHFLDFSDMNHYFI